MIIVGRAVDVIFINFSKGFNKVLYGKMIQRLKDMGFMDTLWN